MDTKPKTCHYRPLACLPLLVELVVVTGWSYYTKTSHEETWELFVLSLLLKTQQRTSMTKDNVIIFTRFAGQVKECNDSNLSYLCSQNVIFRYGWCKEGHVGGVKEYQPILLCWFNMQPC